MSEKIYRNKTIDPEGFPEAVSMDDVEDGTVYGKVGKDYVDGKGRIFLSKIEGVGKVASADNLDEIPDGASYGKYLLSALDNGKALLSQAVGTLDNIANGTYGKVLVTDISAGHILLASAIGNLDNIANGTAYGKIAITDIQAGHILLATAVGTSDNISQGSSNFFAGASGADFRKTIDTLDNVLNGSSYGRILLTDISSGHILLANCVGSLDNIANGTTYNKILATDIYAGHISLIERTTSLKSISLDASVPHVKVAYNGTDVIQMAVVGTEPKLEVYYGGNIRTKINKNGFYLYGTNGVQQGKICGDSIGSQTIFEGTEFYVDGGLSTSGVLGFGGSGSNNTLLGDGTHITFNGLSNAHLVPNSTLIGSACLGTATNYWGDVSYKTLTDRGCLGCFDKGVELQDGSIVSDCESLQAIKKHPTEKTIYGVDKLDYSTFPKVAYKPVKIAEEDIYENRRERHKTKEKNDKGKMIDVEKYRYKKTLRFKKGEKVGADGVEMTSMFSIMIGAIKEIDNRLKTLETNK